MSQPSQFPPQHEAVQVPPPAEYHEETTRLLGELYQVGEAALEQADPGSYWVHIVGGEPSKGNHFDYHYTVARPFNEEERRPEDTGIQISRLRSDHGKWEHDDLTIMPDGSATITQREVSAPGRTVWRTREATSQTARLLSVLPHLREGQVIDPSKYVVVDKPGKQYGSGRELLPTRRIYKQGGLRHLGRRMIDGASKALEPFKP